MTYMMTALRQELSTGLTAVSGAVQQLSATVSLRASAVDAQIQGLGGAIGSVRSDLTTSINAVSSRALRRCRGCVVGPGGSGDCPSSTYSCSEWSDEASVQSFLNFGRCQYKFTVECQL